MLVSYYYSQDQQRLRIICRDRSLAWPWSVANQVVAQVDGLAIFAEPQAKPWLMLLQQSLSCYSKSYLSFLPK